MGARVTVLDVNIDALENVQHRWDSRVTTEFSTRTAVAESVRTADLVIGAVLVTGDKSPIVVDREMLDSMHEGAVIVDISIDQGGCFETSRETTHHDPIYVVDGVVHYAVGNIPGSVPHTSSKALSNATLPYVRALAEGVIPALERMPSLLGGLNTVNGHITNKAVANGLGAPFVDPRDAVIPA
jgi:alanine dehydrogenase